MYKPAKELFNLINNLQGNSIITIYDNNNKYATKWTLPQKRISIKSSQAILLISKIINTMIAGGSVIIYQHTNLNINKVLIRKLYAIMLHDNDWDEISLTTMESKEKDLLFANHLRYNDKIHNVII